MSAAKLLMSLCTRHISVLFKLRAAAAIPKAGFFCKLASEIFNLLDMKKIILLIVGTMLLLSSSCNTMKTKEDVAKAVKFMNNKQYDSAQVYIEALIKEQPNNPVSWYWQGELWFILDDGEKSRFSLNRAIQLNPNYYKAYGLRARLKLINKANDLSDALYDVNKALTIDSLNHETLFTKGSILNEMQRFDEATIICDRLIQLKPKDYFYRCMHANTLKSAGNYNKALIQLYEAIKLKPSDVLAYEIRGFTYLAQNNFDSALTDFLEIVRLVKNNNEHGNLLAKNYNNIGFTFYKLGQNDKALTNIDHSLKLMPSNSYAWKNRALVLLDIGEKEKACLDLKKSKNLDYLKDYGKEVDSLLLVHCE